MNRGNVHAYTGSAESLNQIVITYDSALIVNRAIMILLAAICLTILYLRFSIAERSGNVEKFSVLNLSTAAERVYYSEGSQATRLDQFDKPDYTASAIPQRVALPEVVRANEGIRAHVNKLIAALGVEFQLLRAERSLVVLLPLAVFLSILEVAFYNITPDVSYSAAYATNTAKLLLLFLLGMTVFYTGEATHRDREMRVEQVLWATPAPSNVLLLSKFLAVLSLTGSLIVLVGLAAIFIQLLRGHTPVDLSAYLITYSVTLLPSIVFMTGASLVLNVLLRDKYLAYALSIGTGVGLVYLYSQGYTHWIYNPVLYNLWTYSDLTGEGSGRILIHRLYCLALAGLFLVIAVLCFQRKSTKDLIVNGCLGGYAWAGLVGLVSLIIAIGTGMLLVAQ
ncbi:MAG: hypothetical protein M3447_03580 [Acidobacteriota bacterium]|nr:hypothetical protein [Acidobacteriota bacterium]